MATTTSPSAAAAPAGPGEAARAMRSAVPKQVIPGQAPSLTDLDYLVCFNYQTVDADTPMTTWTYLSNRDLLGKIPWVTKHHELTFEERTTPLLMKSPTCKFGDLIYCTFMRVEKGVTDKTFELNMDAVIKAFEGLVKNENMTPQVAYKTVVERFPEAMRTGYSYPDGDVPHQMNTTESMALYASFSKRSYPERETCPMFTYDTDDDEDYSVDLFKDTTQPAPESQQSLSILAVTANPASPRQQLKKPHSPPPMPQLFSQPHFIGQVQPEPTDGAKKDTHKKGASTPSKQAKGSKSPGGSGGKSKGKGGSSDGGSSSAAGGAGGSGSGGGGKKQPSGGKKRKKSESDSDSDSQSSQTSGGKKGKTKSPKKKAKGKTGGKHQAKSSVPTTSAASTSTTPVAIPTSAATSTQASTSAAALQSQSSVTSQGSGLVHTQSSGRTERPKKIECKPCWAKCRCAQYDDNTILDQINDGMKVCELVHMQIIHQHMGFERIKDRIRTAVEGNNIIKADVKQIKSELAKVKDYAKQGAANMTAKMQKEQDLLAIGKIKHHARLCEVMSNQRESLIRACNHVDPGHLGENFIARYLSELMDDQFHARLYPKTTTTHKLPDGRMLHLGVEYFIFPDELAEIMHRFLKTKFGNDAWPFERFQKKLFAHLDVTRKDMYGQIKNYFDREKSEHIIYNALWWDTHHKTDVFREPAPLWDYCESQDRDEYWDRYEDDFRAITLGKTCEGWPDEHPVYNRTKTGKRSYMLETFPIPEPHWGFQWGE